MLVAADFECSEEVLTIAAMLSTNSNHIFYRPKKNIMKADRKKAKFNDYKVRNYNFFFIFLHFWETRTHCKNKYSRVTI